MARPVVLTYHSIDDQASTLSVRPAAFGAQIDWLIVHGYRFTTVSGLLRADPRDRVVALTFDDGFESVLDVALPLLSRYDVVATVFPITDRLGARTEWSVGHIRLPPYTLMTGEQVRTLVDHGWQIGSHTVDHCCLVNRGQDALRADLARSRRELRQITNSGIDGLSYPNGCHTTAVAAVAAEVGFQWAVGTQVGAVRHDEPYSLRRVNIGASTTQARFRTAFIEPVQSARRIYYRYANRDSPHTHPPTVRVTTFR